MPCVGASHDVVLSSSSEPLLAPDLPRALELCREHGVPDFHFSTNCLAMTDAIMDKIIDVQMPILTVSCDAATKETFEKIRIGKSGYVFLFDGKQKLLVPPPGRTDDLSEAQTRRLAELASTAKEENAGAVRYLDPFSDSGVLVEAYARYFKAFDWHIAVAVPVREIQEPAEAREKPGSVGRPCPGQDIVILRDDDTEAEVGESGEIVGYGRMMMSGYLNRDDANDEATWLDDRGRRWIRSGDVGRVDESGNLYIVDRKKDMILSGGQNIYPADIEAVVASHDNVADVAVIGVRSDKWGETPLAVVVSSNPELDEAGIVEWTNSRVGKQQRIAGVRFIDELPRNPNGKVLKRELRQQYADLVL